MAGRQKPLLEEGLPGLDSGIFVADQPREDSALGLFRGIERMAQLANIFPKRGPEFITHIGGDDIHGGDGGGGDGRRRGGGVDKGAGTIDEEINGRP